jgi:hypothetical protein
MQTLPDQKIVITFKASECGGCTVNVELVPHIHGTMNPMQSSAKRLFERLKTYMKQEAIDHNAGMNN